MESNQINAEEGNEEFSRWKIELNIDVTLDVMVTGNWQPAANDVHELLPWSE